MLIIMRENASQDCVDRVVNFIESRGFQSHVSKGELHTVIGAVGSKIIDPRNIELLDGVQEVIKISSGYKLTSRIFKPEDTIIEVNGIKFGGGHVGLIAHHLMHFKVWEKKGLKCSEVLQTTMAWQLLLK